MLRHYDQIGLLVPYEKDFMTGYRYYDVNQLDTAREIIRYKELGFPLKRIKELIATHVEPGEMDIHLREQLTDVDRRISELLRVRSQLRVDLNMDKKGQRKMKTQNFTQQIATLLDRMPRAMQSGIVVELYETGELPEALTSELGSEQWTAMLRKQRLDTILAILEQCPGETRQIIVESLKDDHPELSDLIRWKLPVMEDIARLDDRSIQNLLRHLEMNDLAVALKDAGQQLLDRLQANMSDRAWKLMEKTRNGLGPVRLTTVRNTQKKIIGILNSLAVPDC